MGLIALGLPKGFDRLGPHALSDRVQVVRLWHETPPDWNHLNIPVWAMEKDGFLFVRTFAPRINTTWVDVIQGGTLDLVKSFHAIDVAEFIDVID